MLPECVHMVHMVTHAHRDFVWSETHSSFIHFNTEDVCVEDISILTRVLSLNSYVFVASVVMNSSQFQVWFYSLYFLWNG